MKWSHKDVTIYTDGSVQPKNPGIGGYSVIIYEPKKPKPIILRCTHEGLVDILTCEIFALQKAIKFCLRQKYGSSLRIVIFCDNELAVNMITSGPYRRLFWFGVIGLGNVVPMLLLLSGIPALAALAGICVLLGIYFSEHIWVQAPQQIPLS